MTSSGRAEARPAARLTRAAVTATLLAGVIGVVRQRGEAREIRTGHRPPGGPDADPAPRRPVGPLAACLAAWVPARPISSAGRAMVAVWSAPLTALGIAAALVGGARPRRDRARGCWVATGVRGPSALALDGVGATANTIGRVVLVTGTTPSRALLDHEAVHVRQAERLGPFLPIAYAWLGARYGYADNPLERAARLGARRAPRTGPGAAVRGSRAGR